MWHSFVNHDDELRGNPRCSREVPSTPLRRHLHSAPAPQLDLRLKSPKSLSYAGFGLETEVHDPACAFTYPSEGAIHGSFDPDVTPRRSK